MKPSKMVVGEPARRLKLREVPDERWRVQRALGLGRVLEFASEDMRLEVFMPPWAGIRSGAAGDAVGRVGVSSSFDTAIMCRYGPLLSDGASAMWCLLGGVPLPAFGATREEAELRLSVALARAPAPLTTLIGPLALVPSRAPGSDAPAQAGPALDESQAVDVMLRLTRGDVTVYARASAAAELWLQLASGMASLSGPPAERRALEALDDDMTVSVPVQIAAGHVPAETLRRLTTGDVLRMPTSFTTAGRGRLSIGGFEIDVRWHSRSPRHVFEVSSVVSMLITDPSAYARTTSESTSMNDNDQGSSGDARSPAIALDEPYLDEPDGELSDEVLYRTPTGSASEGYDDDEDAADASGSSPADAPAVDRLPITMVAEIGTLTMTLGALKMLRPGNLIKLGPRGHDEVVLRSIEGPPVAYAELVDIGGHLGMQVIRLADA